MSTSTERVRRWRERRGMNPGVREVSRVCKGCGGDLPSSRWIFCSDLCSLPVTKIRIPNCATCGKPFVARTGNVAVCSDECRRKRDSARWAAKARNREHIRRTSVSDITSAQELAMRKRARKCPMPGCGVKLTDEPNLPSSKHLDHILPLAAGGTHTHGNVRIICANCNLKRPKDGSDFTGQLTLWAQGPVQVSRQHGGCNTETCRKGLHPWIPENIEHHGTKRRCKPCRMASQQKRGKNPVGRQCKCGAVITTANQYRSICPACTDVAVRRAIELHSGGNLSWGQVADQVGYGSGWGIAYAARRLGYIPAPKPAKPPKAEPQRACPDCGTPKPSRKGMGKGSGQSRCEPCATAKAWRAVEMYRRGATLEEIGSHLGYSSKTGVSNLMKSVTAVDMRRGRPCKV